MTDDATRLRQLAASAERDGTLPATDFIRAIRVTAHDETSCSLCGEAFTREPAQLVASHVRTALLHLQCFDAWADLLGRKNERASPQHSTRHARSTAETTGDTGGTNGGGAHEAQHVTQGRRWEVRPDEDDTLDEMREGHFLRSLHRKANGQA